MIVKPLITSITSTKPNTPSNQYSYTTNKHKVIKDDNIKINFILFSHILNTLEENVKNLELDPVLEI